MTDNPRLARLTELYGDRLGGEIQDAEDRLGAYESAPMQQPASAEARRVLERFRADVADATKRALGDLEELGLIR